MFVCTCGAPAEQHPECCQGMGQLVDVGDGNSRRHRMNILVCLNCDRCELREPEPGEPDGGEFLPFVCDVCKSEAAADEGQ